MFGAKELPWFSCRKESGGDFTGEIRMFFHPAKDTFLRVETAGSLMDVTETLRTFLESGEDWERKGTSLR
ncbi:MAG: hypothetical protein LUQ25_06685, partial [Methanoregulaceae archaeon]|nr:hypothetical protein [Methanoregulaceae archaeon]